MPVNLILIFLFCSYPVFAIQKHWAGSITGDWANASNWKPLGIPEESDDVVLDNNVQVNNYSVTLPVTTVNVHTILIAPAMGKHIELTLPLSNQSSPALIVNGTGNCFIIQGGGVFRNSSGLTSGSSIQLNGLLCITGEGRYIHNSRSSHATDIVAKLSAARGTEKGVFEFDVPGGSYPISLSNRVYGTLILSSVASGGSQTYNASGSNPVTINGNFQVNIGVQLNLDLVNDMIIFGDYIQTGGTFNVASQPNSNTIKIKGIIQQSTLGVITETSNGFPLLELCGEKPQPVSFTGSITNEVTLKINNPEGIQLSSPLNLSYKLQLADGKIKTSTASLLTILDNGVISGGSETSFIDGPMKKAGDDDFEFPVGKQGDYAPVKITGPSGSVTDEYLAEYFLADPGLSYGFNFENPPVIRISRLEFWSVERIAGSSSKKISLHVGKYSNATDLEKLVVVGWDNGNTIWKNAGNSFHMGITMGTITSGDVSRFGVFTLGSTVQEQNPLPVSIVKREPRRIPGSIPPGPSFTIFPSLVKDRLYIQPRARRKESIRLMVTDIQGKRILLLDCPLIEGSNTMTIYLGHLANGTYYISLYGNNGLYGNKSFQKI